MNYTKSEEDHAEKCVKEIAATGVKLIMAGGSVSDICLHYIEKYELMVLRITSKFELKRICKAMSAVPKASFEAPAEDEIGICGSANV